MAQHRKGTLAIVGMGFISPAGSTFDDLQRSLEASEAPTVTDDRGSFFPVPTDRNSLLDEAVAQIHGGSRLDRTVKLAAFATRCCLQNLQSLPEGKALVNIGSSRGATDTWETEFSRFLETGLPSPKASPYSTPGNISSNVAALLAGRSVAVDHSVTCGSGLQALANSAAWIRAGMAEWALAGGAEAPLTPFTRAQMSALKITSAGREAFPAKPLYSGKPKTGMLLGEGAAVFALTDAAKAPDVPFLVAGIGLANEKGGSPSGITGEGRALYEAMTAALADARLERPDLIITHAPGTEKGDQAELEAIRRLFGENMPRLFSNKHIMGHTLGASGCLSLVTACHLLRQGRVPSLPYPAYGQTNDVMPLRSVLINATGFGGNAVSIVVVKGDSPA